MSPAYQQRIARFRYVCRKLSDDQAKRVKDMRERGMTYPAIARWFTNNRVPISWQTARRACQRADL